MQQLAKNISDCMLFDNEPEGKVPQLTNKELLFKDTLHSNVEHCCFE